MTRHITGFILFSFIIVVSSVIAFIFGELPQPEKTTVMNVPRFESKSRCQKQHHDYYSDSKFSVKVAQSVFNERTKLFDTNLAIKRENSSVENVTFALHFFAKDSNGTRYLASENYYIKPDFDDQGAAIQGLPSRLYQWFDGLKLRENIYVIAEAGNHKYNDEIKQPDFDENKATAIISLKGK